MQASFAKVCSRQFTATFFFLMLYNIIKSMPYFMPGVFVAVDTRRVMWTGGE